MDMSDGRTLSTLEVAQSLATILSTHAAAQEKTLDELADDLIPIVADHTNLRYEIKVIERLSKPGLGSS